MISCKSKIINTEKFCFNPIKIKKIYSKDKSKTICINIYDSKYQKNCEFPVIDYRDNIPRYIQMCVNSLGLFIDDANLQEDHFFLLFKLVERIQN